MRNIISLNSGWSFTKEGKTEVVALPHTWNAVDGSDGGNDYYRGTCVYERTLTAADIPEGDLVYLEIPAANASAEVFYNDVSLASHDGGYSLFRAKLGSASVGDQIRILVDNSANDRVYPQMADFTFYGGLYRGAALIGVNGSHFDLMDHGSSGLYVTPFLEEGKARITLQGVVSASDEALENLKVCYTILSQEGEKISSVTVPAEQNAEISLD